MTPTDTTHVSRLEALLDEVRRMYAEGNIKDALTIARECYDLSKPYPDINFIRSAVQLSRPLIITAQFKEGRQILEEVFPILFRFEDDYPIECGDVYNNYGTLVREIGDQIAGIENYKNALKLYTKGSFHFGQILALNNLGSAYMELGDYSKSTFYLNKALEYADTYKEYRKKNRTLYYLAIIFQNTGKFDQSLGLLSEVLKTIGNDHHLEVMALVCYSGLLNKLSRYKESLAISDQVIQKATELSSGNLLAQALHNKAFSLMEDGQLDVAEKFFFDCIRAFETQGDQKTSFHPHISLGDLYRKRGQFTKALIHYEKARGIAEKVHNKKNIAEALNEMYAIHKMERNYEKALQIHEHLAIVDKEIIDETGNLRLKNIQLQQRNQEKLLLEVKLKQQDALLVTQALHLASQTDLLDKFQTDLRTIVKEIDDPIAALKKIKEKLKELPCSQIDWTKFELQFNEVHPDFKKKFAERYPELTEMERRIAVMVRMDLKSIDIAKLFCITERAVEFHRLNLRKKLQLKQGEALPKFLQTI